MPPGSSEDPHVRRRWGHDNKELNEGVDVGMESRVFRKSVINGPEMRV